MHIEVVSNLDSETTDELASLVEAATLVDGHEPLGEHKFLRIAHGDDQSVALLARDAEGLVGYAHALRYQGPEDVRVSLEVVVHPEFRGRGIGRALLLEGVEHARRQDASRVDVWAYNESQSVGRMADGLGFTVARRLLHLHRHVSAGAAPPPRRPGVVLRGFRPGDDDAAWIALNARVFAGHPENGAWTSEDLGARFAEPWFDPRDFLLLEVDGVLSGFCWLKVDQRGNDGRVGEIYVFGVAPDYEGRGLARYLLATALARLEGRDVRVAAVYVDAANVRALRLYQMYGFHHHHVDVCYALDLREQQLDVTPKAAVA